MVVHPAAALPAVLERNALSDGADADDPLPANATRLVCDSPPLPEGSPAGPTPARVRVTNNGDAAALGPSEVSFTYFDAATPRAVGNFEGSIDYV